MQKLKKGTKIEFDYQSIKGNGVIVGYGRDYPITGTEYIVKCDRDLSTIYPYDTFICPEIYLKIKQPKQNLTGIPDTFIIDIEEWYHNGIAPEGLEDLELSEDIDTSTGDYDAEKGAMLDYEIVLHHTNGKDCWVGIGGYYTGPNGHCFYDNIKFEYCKED